MLVACEFSGIVRDAFIARGHDAVSCDLLPCERTGPHIQGDAIATAYDPKHEWDLIIAHPPRTYLTVSGNKWMKPEYADRFPNRPAQREEAIQFFLDLYDAPVERIAVENLVGILSTRFRKPDQIVQPYQFGHPERKTTCLWLRGLPPLTHTDVVPCKKTSDGGNKLYLLPPSKDRWKKRSTTFQGIADAMADQWGSL